MFGLLDPLRAEAGHDHLAVGFIFPGAPELKSYLKTKSATSRPSRGPVVRQSGNGSTEDALNVPLRGA